MTTKFVIEDSEKKPNVKDLKIISPYTLVLENDHIYFKEKWIRKLEVEEIDDPLEIRVYSEGCLDKNAIGGILLEFEGEVEVWKITFRGYFGDEEIYIPKMSQAKEIFKALIEWKYPTLPGTTKEIPIP